LHFPCGTVFNRVNEFNPQIYAKCQKMMRVVVFIEDPAMIRKIVKHLNLWNLKRPSRSVTHASPSRVFPTNDEHLAPPADDYVTDPVYHLDSCFKIINKTVESLADDLFAVSTPRRRVVCRHP